MPHSQFLQLLIGNRSFDVPTNEELPVVIDFEIEDDDNFEKKNGTTALNITVPATLENSEALNTFFNVHSEDLSPDNWLKDVQPMSLSANGNELIVGKAMIKRGRKLEVPVDFEVDLYANNADWAIQNSELTLHDVINAATHIFDLSSGAIPGVIDLSWSYDGTVKNQFFVYAPVRYRESFLLVDTDLPVDQLRPSLFLYWLIREGFRMAGYKISSTFMDSNYFRRMVLPWTWGNFLFIDSPELDILKFKAKLSAYSNYYNGTNGTFTHTMNEPGDGFKIDNETTDGAFDNAGTYAWDGNSHGVFTYLNALYTQFGKLQFIFRLSSRMSYDVTYGSDLTIDIKWFVNGVLNTTQNVLTVSAGPVQQILGAVHNFETYFTSPGIVGNDTIDMAIEIGQNVGVSPFGSNIALDWAILNDHHVTFELVGFKIPLGGTVDFKKYPFLKNYKWLDLLRGSIDMFNLQINSDSIEKTVYIEPTHQYTTGADLTSSMNPGYYNGNIKDWTDKQDLSKYTDVENYADYDQTFKIALREDVNDGMLKLISDRHTTNLSESLYQFPTRFKKGIREMENRFFSGVMHYKHEAFKSITGISPQLIALIPENIANSSNPSAGNTFMPKLAYYKGLVDRTVYGGWSLGGDNTFDLPYMFAVNYVAGGESDPVLTYCDQNIEGVKAFGLFKRYFWQRFAIMRHGKKMSCFMHLNNSDVMDYLQREYKKIGEGKFQLIRISGYQPLMNETTECGFWLWFPVTQDDNINTFPSEDSVLNNSPLVNTIDPKYNRLLCLSSDIPI